MTTLRVIIDEMLESTPGSVGRYTEELVRELITTAPRGCYVEAVVAASTEHEYALIEERLPGLRALHKSALARRELQSAWQHGFTRLPGKGMVHAPSLLAPLAKHDRLHAGDQIAVTVHDVVAWTRPDALSPRVVSWHKAMLKRAQRYADAIVVPSHAVAEQLRDIMDLGDRVRVIGGAANSSLDIPDDADERADRLSLPETYLLAIGGLDPRKGIDQLVAAMPQVSNDVPLLIVGPNDGDPALTTAIAAAGLAPQRVRGLGTLTDPDLAVALDRAAVFVYANLEEGFGMPVLEAFTLGTPVVHSDAPALLELAVDAGVVVERGDDAGYPGRLAAGINSVLDDHDLAERLAYSGSDRAKAYSWRSAAEKVWQLHADL